MIRLIVKTMIPESIAGPRTMEAVLEESGKLASSIGRISESVCASTRRLFAWNTLVSARERTSFP